MVALLFEHMKHYRIIFSVIKMRGARVYLMDGRFLTRLEIKKN